MIGAIISRAIIPALFLLVVLLQLTSADAGAGGAWYEDDGDPAGYIYLGNPFMEIHLKKYSVEGETRSIGVSSIIDVNGGNVEFINAGETSGSDPFHLYRIQLVDNLQKGISVGPVNAIGVDYVLEDFIGGIKITISTVHNLEDHGEILVRVSITLYDMVPKSVWNLEAENRSGLSIMRSRFPFLGEFRSIGTSQADDFLVLPLYDGILLKNPNGNVEPGGSVSGIYPGSLSMQFMAVYSHEGGLYLLSNSTEGDVLRFALEKVAGQDFSYLYIEHFVAENPGNDFCMDSYDVELGVFQGGWGSIADQYKAWAQNQWWMEDEESPVPDWFENGYAILNCRNYYPCLEPNPIPELSCGDLIFSLPQLAALSGEYGNALESPIINLWTGWEQWGEAKGPAFFPPREGQNAFQEAVNQVHGDGSRVFIYLNPVVWSLDEQNHFHDEGEDDSAKRVDGGPIYLKAGFGEFALMCPETDGWKKRVKENIEEAAALGVDMVQLDLFPLNTPYACYDPSHGHPLGTGKWVHRAWRELVAEARRAGKRLNPDLVVSAEQMNELYLPLFDTYTSRDSRYNPSGGLYGVFRERFGEDFKTIPLFSYVYHENIITQGYEGEYIDDHFLSYELTSEDNDYYVWAVARELVRGKLATGLVFKGQAVPASINQQNLSFLKKAGRAVSTYLRDYAFYGSLLLALPVDVPDFIIQIPVRPGDPEVFVFAPTVVSGAWKSPSNKMGYVFVNVSDTIQDFDYELSPHDLRGASFDVTEMRDEEIIETRSEILLPATLQVTIEPKQIATYLIAPHEDSPDDGSGCGACAITQKDDHPWMSHVVIYSVLFGFLVICKRYFVSGLSKLSKTTSKSSENA